MDVRCGRCGTEYEFDDALISDRGTTVKCTNCGYQFKVFPDAAAAAPERWMVRTVAGRELLYTTLRDLQRGIAKGHVGAEDLLSRGNRPARPLSAIAELEPFLQNQRSVEQQSARTLHGIAPAATHTQGGANSAPYQPDAAPANSPAGRPQQLNTPALDTSAPPEPRVASEPGLGGSAIAQMTPGSTGHEALTKPELEDAHPASSQGDRAVHPTADPALAPAPVAAQPRRDLAAARMLLQHDDRTDPQYASIPARRHARSRWLVLVVLLAAGGLLAGTVGKRYLERYTKPADESTAKTADARVINLLSDGERLLNEGDLEGAKEAFAKASALAEENTQVLTALASLEVLWADMTWLKLRLLDPEDKPAIERTHRELGARVGRTERAVAALMSQAPEALETKRLLVHARRLSGKLGEARQQVASVSKNASLPENAYALAALDLAEEAPVWSSVVHRLRIAAASEGGLGQARASLIYALTRSGQTDAAQAELEKPSKNGTARSLVYDLREFVERHAGAADAGPDAASAVEPRRLPELDTSDLPAESPAGSGDFRAQLKRAYSAAQRGDLRTAERLYNAVLARHPGNTEALAGLADIARQRNDTARASELYSRVLEQNPSYLPALMASADQKWAAGDRAGALKLYRQIVEQAGSDSSYGQRALARIAQAEQKPSGPTEPDSQKPATAAESAAPSPAPPDGSTEQDAEPHIDTTDLPEFNR